MPYLDHEEETLQKALSDWKIQDARKELANRQALRSRKNIDRVTENVKKGAQRGQPSLKELRKWEQSVLKGGQTRHSEAQIKRKEQGLDPLPTWDPQRSYLRNNELTPGISDKELTRLWRDAASMAGQEGRMATKEDFIWNLDHVNPVNRGGQHTFSNLGFTDAPSNQAKSDYLKPEFELRRQGKLVYSPVGVKPSGIGVRGLGAAGMVTGPITALAEFLVSKKNNKEYSFDDFMGALLGVGNINQKQEGPMG